MNKLFTILITILLVGCNVDLSSNYKVSDNYYVGIIDIPENRSLYYDMGDGSGIGRVGAEVKAVGWNKSHIIVEQQKDNKVLFYILEIKKDHKYANPSESVSGPFTKSAFDEAKEALNVDPNLRFSKRFGWFAS